MSNNPFQLCSQALREALACIGLGLRDTRHAGLWWRSALCSIAIVCLWLWLYYRFGVFFIDAASVVALACVGGLLSVGALSLGPGLAAEPATLSNMGSLNGLGGLLKTAMSVAQVALVAMALVAFVYVLMFVVGTLTTARLTAPWLHLARAREVAARRYPGWQPRDVALPAPRSALRRVLGLLALLIPVWSAVVIVRTLVAGNVRWMYGAAAEGLLDPQQRRALAAAQRPAIFMLGLLLCVMMLVPVLNLLVPAVLCSSICHLQRRGWTSAQAHAAAPPVAAALA